MADVVGGADEGDGHGIDALADGEDEVFLVLLGQRRDLDRDAGEVDALVLAKGAAVDNLADDIDAVYLLNAKFDEAVGEPDHGVARLERPRGLRVLPAEAAQRRAGEDDLLHLRLTLF